MDGETRSAQRTSGKLSAIRVSDRRARKFVAIEHTLKITQKVLIEPRIRYALQMIYRNHIDLRPVMEMHLGPNARHL
jgi:hypothetical protein